MRWIRIKRKDEKALEPAYTSTIVSNTATSTRGDGGYGLEQSRRGARAVEEESSSVTIQAMGHTRIRGRCKQHTLAYGKMKRERKESDSSIRQNIKRHQILKIIPRHQQHTRKDMLDKAHGRLRWKIKRAYAMHATCPLHSLAITFPFILIRAVGITRKLVRRTLYMVN